MLYHDFDKYKRKKLLTDNNLPDTERVVNWAGFYLGRAEKQLVLGPFGGQPACLRIAIDPPKGVCGNAAHKRETIVVSDVHDFDGHIACDANTEAEIVVPMVTKDQKLIGVLDLDALPFKNV